MTLKVEIGGNDIGDAILVAAAIVQAVGSVAAILIAVWISHRDRKEVRREAMSDRVQGLAALIFRADELVKKTYDTVTVEGWKGYSRAQREWLGDHAERQRCAEALKAIPLHELQNWELVRAVMEMIEALSAIDGAASKFFKENKAGVSYPDYGAPVFSALSGPVNLSAEAVARIQNQLRQWGRSTSGSQKPITPRIVV